MLIFGKPSNSSRRAQYTRTHVLFSAVATKGKVDARPKRPEDRYKGLDPNFELTSQPLGRCAAKHSIPVPEVVLVADDCDQDVFHKEGDDNAPSKGSEAHSVSSTLLTTIDLSYIYSL
jgi:hypothetical protein